VVIDLQFEDAIPNKESMSRWLHSRGPSGRDEDKDPPSPGAPEKFPAEVGAGSAEEPPSATIEDPDDPPTAQEVRMDRADDRSEVSVVGRGTRIEGTVVAAGSLRVEGEVKGKITAEQEVSLSAQGRVEANIQATSITLAGEVKGDLTAKADVSLPADSRLDGNIRARNVEVGGVVIGDIMGNGKVELGPRARVEGDITSKSLAIAEGAVFVGRSIMGEETRQVPETREGTATTKPVERIAT
jgi:cytoskeletal protein CcmA (bactofilin family)